MIIGENVKLLALDSKYENIVLKWVNDPEIKEMIGTLYPVSDVEHKKWFNTKQIDPLNKTFIISNMNDDILGLIGLTNTNLINRNAELFIYIGEKQYWGKGLGLSAVNTLCDFAFKNMNLYKVYLNVFEYNSNAIKTYIKAGFKTEGVFQEHIYKNGEYHNVRTMAKIKGGII
ncbi:GNAT family protein [Exiguobacterium acetylicum]|uniref:GNAT family N-acetyltransferase n=1 Tax=Exiguobacterium acetylicum TaxID=41170 RepID=UPI0027E16717|nr:GNAT family protein [Exiguobacterium acetylicum]MDQ6467865.1 GNAT family protein [Exiguobacterium acetylicum]